LVLYLLLDERRRTKGIKKRESEKQQGWVIPQGWTCHAVCHRLQLLGEIKGWFKGQSLNFFLHLIWWWLFWLEAVRIYPNVTLMSQGGLWSHRA
jgi:hypothetical protein